MRRFINKIFGEGRYRKLTVGATAILTLIGLILPKTTMAALPLVAALVSGGAGWLWGLITDVMTWAVIVAGILYVLMQFAGALLGIAGTFADWMLQPAYIINSTVVQIGWGVTRDLANMFFILILLGIALDYILFQSFGVKRALPTLIVVALLINFSLPIAGIFIDFANVFSDFFITKVTGGCLPGDGKSCGFTIAIANNLNLTSLFSAAIGSQSVIVDMIFSIFLMLGPAFILFALGIMFLLRTGWLYALLILLPLVLVLMPFPKTSSYFGRWTNRFFQWTFFAPVALFFLYLSMLIFQANTPNLDEIGKGYNYKTTSATTILMNSAQAETFAQGASGGFIEQVIKYVVVWFFMLGSLMAAQTMSITGAGAALGMIKSTQKWAGGKVKSAGKQVGGAAARRAKVDEHMGKAAEWASKNKVLSTLGVGRGLRGMAVKTEQAFKKQGELTTQEKAKYENMSRKEREDEYNDLKNSKLPYAQDKAAQLAAIRARKGELTVRDKKGDIDKKATEALVREVYGFAKKYKNKDAQKAVIKASPIIGKELVREDWAEEVKKGNVAKTKYEGEIYDIKTRKRIGGKLVEGVDKRTGKKLEDAINDVFDISKADFENMKGMWDKNSTEAFIESGNLTPRGHLRVANEMGDTHFTNYVRDYYERIEGISNPADRAEAIAKIKKLNPSLTTAFANGNLTDLGLGMPKAPTEWQ